MPPVFPPTGRPFGPAAVALCLLGAGPLAAAAPPANPVPMRRLSAATVAPPPATARPVPKWIDPFAAPPADPPDEKEPVAEPVVVVLFGDAPAAGTAALNNLGGPEPPAAGRASLSLTESETEPEPAGRAAFASEPAPEPRGVVTLDLGGSDEIEPPTGAVVPTHAAPAEEKVEPVIVLPPGPYGRFCPVAVRDGRALTPADPAVTLDRGGERWRFASPVARAAFALDPARYEPVAGGADVVLAAAEGFAAPGRVEHAVLYGGRLFLFRSAATRDAFAADPDRFVNCDADGEHGCGERSDGGGPTGARIETR